MKVKHKLLLDYQYVSVDKKIFLIKSGTIIEEYIYSLKGESINIDKEIVDANPQIFQIIDWKNELLTHLKVNKIGQPAQVSKKIIPFIEEILLSASYQQPVTIDTDKIKELEDESSKLERLKIRLTDREDDISLRETFLAKREKDFKERIESTSNKEFLLEKSLDEVKSKVESLNEREQYLNDKERNIDNMILNSSVEVEERLKEIQDKIDDDFKSLSAKEMTLNSKQESLNNIENKLNQKELSLNKKEELLKIESDNIQVYKEEVYRILAEIEQWESLHWKFKSFKRPPSTE